MVNSHHLVCNISIVGKCCCDATRAENISRLISEVVTGDMIPLNTGRRALLWADGFCSDTIEAIILKKVWNVGQGGCRWKSESDIIFYQTNNSNYWNIYKYLWICVSSCSKQEYHNIKVQLQPQLMVHIMK